jgi:heme exporter protein A
MLITIKTNNLTKRFNNNTVFQNINFSINISKSLAVTGENGSGKSTLLEIIAGIQKPTSGKMIYEIDGNEVAFPGIQDYISFSSPKINPYGELTAYENLEFVFNPAINENKKNNEFAEQLNTLLNKFNLYNDRNKRVKYYSTGMKQRLRLIFAFLHDPHILILDEPCSNLDNNGKDAVYSYLESVKSEKIVIIASNESEEAGLCDNRINLEKPRF